jgi:starch phosphorylase
VAATIRADPAVNRRLSVVFIPNFNVQNGQLIYPAADLSEQISTAGKEASGTGNMKFMLNGALTIGTLDGANVEMREEVGAENFFVFGLNAAEVELTRASYQPESYLADQAGLRAALDLLACGHFSGGDLEIAAPVVENLRRKDPYLVLADYASYVACQEQVSALWQDPELWTRKSVLNTARSGKFSSDRAIAEYCSEIWNVPGLPWK